MAVEDVEWITGLLIGIHYMMAVRMQAPELILEADEAKSLATALARVQRHFDFKISPLMADCGALAYTAGEIYMKRLWAIRARQARPVNPGQPASAGAGGPTIVGEATYADAAE